MLKSELKSIIIECLEELNEGPARNYKKNNGKIEDASPGDELKFRQKMKNFRGDRHTPEHTKGRIKFIKQYSEKYGSGKHFGRTEDLGATYSVKRDKNSHPIETKLKKFDRKLPK